MVKKVQISVLVPEYYLEAVDKKVSDGTFPSRLEAFKTAIYKLVSRELSVAHEFQDEIKHY